MSSRSRQADHDAELVRELLEDSNALENLAGTRKKLLREKNLIDSQLHAGIQGQMQILSQGMLSLRLARESVGDARATLSEMEETYKESTKQVTGFEDIQRIAQMLANFDLTQKFVGHFESFGRDTDAVRRLLAADGEFDIDKPMQNLIPAHYLLSQLRQVREEALGFLGGRDATSDTRLTVRKLYEPLDTLIAAFDTTIMTIAEDLLETLRVGNRSLIVRVAKIIETEERRDLLAKFSQQSQSGVASTSASAAEAARKPRNYLERFFESIKSSVDAQFENCMSTYPPDTQPELLLENLSFVHSELRGAKDDLVPCCPARWQIFNKFMLWYHQGVHRTLEAIMRFEPSAQILLELLQFVRNYYKTTDQVFGVSRKTTPELLDPPLLDGRERNLYDDYLQMLISKLMEWYENIWRSEVRDFKAGTLNPEYHADGVGLETQTTVTKLISQQLETAAESENRRVILGCVDACCEVLMNRQQAWTTLIHEATQKEISGAPDAPQGLYEYIFVVANDQDRAYAFLDQLSAKWAATLGPRHQSRVTQRFEEAQEGYQDVTKECFLCNLRMIYSDTQPAFKEIFKSDKWYAGVTVKAIIDTYVDFVEDARKLLLRDLFEIFVGKLCTETILWYLQAITAAPGSKPKKLNMPRGKERIMADAKLLYDFFTREELGLDPEVIRKAFFIFDTFGDVLVAPLEEIPDLFNVLRAHERDAPLDLFEMMLSLRRDVNAKQITDTMVEVRQVAVQVEPQADEAEGEDYEHSFLYEFNKGLKPA